MLLGYIRVSSATQVDGTSLGSQERVVKAVALAKGIRGFNVAMYCDDGISGSVPFGKRPEGSRVIADAQKGDIIVAAKLDRCFRDALDALETFNYCKAKGIDLILYDLGNESVIRDGISKLMFTVVTAFAEMERSRIRERVISGKAAKKAMGGHTGGLAPYGFRKVGQGKQSRLEPDPDEQETVALVKHLYHQTTVPEACRELTRLGVRNRVGQPFHKVQVLRIAERRV